MHLPLPYICFIPVLCKIESCPHYEVVKATHVNVDRGAGLPPSDNGHQLDEPPQPSREWSHEYFRGRVYSRQFGPIWLETESSLLLLSSEVIERKWQFHSRQFDDDRGRLEVGHQGSDRCLGFRQRCQCRMGKANCACEQLWQLCKNVAFQSGHANNFPSFDAEREYLFE